MKGFLGTGATFSADLNLVIQIAMGCALLAGMVLARRKQFVAHKYCQSSVMVLNLFMIALIMGPSFHRQVHPEIHAHFGDAYYLVAVIHATLGTIAELLGLFIVLRAATNLVPMRLRFKRYKIWMRTELVLWWVVVLLGMGTYYLWYIAPPANIARQSAAPTEKKPTVITIKISNFQFEPKELTVAAGTTIAWIDEGGRHSVEAEDGSFKSETLVAGSRFQHTFNRPGVFPFFCGFHGGKAGKGMSGVITVISEPK